MKILLIGCGNIGSALLETLRNCSKITKIVVISPSTGGDCVDLESDSVSYVADLSAVPADFAVDLIIIAVKPQSFHHVRADIAHRSHKAVIVSTMASVSLAELSAAMPKHQNIIRVMPNIAIKTAQSIHLAVAAAGASIHAIKTFADLFALSGKVVWMKREEELDLLTPISGSGPAYFYLLAETLLSEVVKIGIDSAIAKEIVDQLFLGSASLIEEDTSYSSLIQSVTSKKGVTEAALDVMRPHMQQCVQASVSAAWIRMKEIAQSIR